jgi:hypothetical protein
MEKQLTFDNWFDIFTDEVTKLGYLGPIDKDTFESNYENDKSPEDSAKEFVKEMND